MATKKETKAPAKAEKKDHPAVAKATQDAAAHCIKNGFHDKLRNVVKDLPEDHPFKLDALKKADELDAKAKAKKKVEAKKRSIQQITPEKIQEKFKDLHDVLAEFELQEKLRKKPFRHAVVARRRIKVFGDNFKRNCG